MNTQQPQRCFSCKRKLEQTVVYVPEGASSDDYLIHQSVWVSPLERWIGFCDKCYNLQRFDKLEQEEISALHWAFGRCDPEDTPEMIERKIQRVHMASEGLPCGEVFAALAHAYLLAGRKSEARTWATKAISWARKYPGRELAEEILRDD
jgi:hypothetical protein